jgi:hypothetical protein
MQSRDDSGELFEAVAVAEKNARSILSAGSLAALLRV